MGTITDQNKTKFFTSFQNLVDYLLNNSGILEEDLPDILNQWLTGKLASATDVENHENLSGLITVDTAQKAAQKAIAEWVQTAPEALDTIQELAAAFQNDPDIIQKLFDMLAGKADKSELNKRQFYSNIDFMHSDWDAFFNFNAAGYTSRPPAMYVGTAPASRLKIADQYPEVDVTEECLLKVTSERIYYRVVQLDASHFIGADVRFNIAHLNQLEKARFYKNGIRYTVPVADIDGSNETELRITNVDWVEGDEIRVEFNTYVTMGLASNMFIMMEASLYGSTFRRNAKIYNGVLEADPAEGYAANTWRNSELDLSLTIDAIISAVDTAIPAEETPPE